MWSASLPLLKRLVPVRRLVALMWSPRGRRRFHGQEHAVLILAARLSRLRPRLRANCLERSLLAYRFLARAGCDPRLVLGVHRNGGVLTGHAWVTLNGKPVYEHRETLEQFTPLVEFGPQGVAREIRRDGPPAHFPDVWE